jgi:hypothetical protein
MYGLDIGDNVEEGLMKYTHVDLFSGIGGFACAAKQTWGGGLPKYFILRQQ